MQYNFVTTWWQIHSQSLSSNHGTWKSQFSLNSPEKFETPDKRGSNSQERAEPSRQLPAPQPTPTHKLSMTFTVQNISISQPVCAPSQLLHTCSLAEHEKLEKSPWLHSNNWKHQCYQHSSCTKSKPQQLLGGNLTLPQPKPGQL